MKRHGILFRTEPEGEGETKTPSNPPSRPKGSPNVQGFIAGKAGGDPIMAVSILLGERFQQRQRIRSLEADLATAGKIAPKEGQRVLSKEEAEELEAYRALGKPGEVKTKVDELQGKLSKIEQDQQVGAAMEAVGYKNPTILNDLVVARGLKLELREETKDGKQVKIPYVKAGDKDSVPLTQYVESEAKDYLVPLKGTTTSENSDARGGIRFPASTGGSSGGEGGSGDKVAERIAARQKAREEGLKVSPLHKISTIQ